MQKLPVETLIQIFELACTDGGFTGCSLSQTSRAIRAVSQHVRFHSIALSISRTCLESFLASYEHLDNSGECTGNPPKIVHLHLTDDREDVGDAIHDTEYEANDSAPNVDPDAPSCHHAVRLVQLVADDLVSLVLPSRLMSPGADTPLFTGCRSGFPSLRALIMYTPKDGAVWAAPALSPESASGTNASTQRPLFPALTHMHIVFPPDAPLTAPYDTWNTHAPRTTHLRLSFYPMHEIKEIDQDTRRLLGLPSRRRDTTTSPRAAVWPSVRHMAIQPANRFPRKYLDGEYGQLALKYWRTLRWQLTRNARLARQEGAMDVRVLEPWPFGVKRWDPQVTAAIRVAWERIITRGVESDWLTFGEEDEKPL